MDVILLKAVEKLGSEGTVVDVKSGFARNYLIPRGLAALATAEQLSAVAAAARSRQQKTERIKEAAALLKRQLEGHALTMTLTLGEDGKSFGSVTAHDIIDALSRDGLTVEKHALHLEQPIKALGVYDVPVRLHPDVSAIVKLSVVKA